MRPPKQQGFTLMEVIIVLFLFSILLMGLMNIFDWHQKVYLLEQAEVRATGSVRTTLNEMSRYVAQGTQIMPSRTINGQTYNTGTGALVVEIPSVDAIGSIISGTFDYVTYYVSGNDLYQVIEKGVGSVRPAGKRQLSQVILTLVFTYNNTDPTQASIVTVDINAQARARGNSTVSARAVDIIFLRNR